jgi:hypothetical protein
MSYILGRRKYQLPSRSSMEIPVVPVLNARHVNDCNPTNHVEIKSAVSVPKVQCFLNAEDTYRCARSRS